MMGARKAGIRTVAVIEFAKGALVLTVGSGLVASFHRDAQRFAEQLVGHMHLNPAKHDPEALIHAIASWNDARLWWLAGMSATYALLRIGIGWGLWLRRAWAEWLAIIAAAIYVPIEINGLMHGVTVLRTTMLVVNLAIVGFMGWALLSRRQEST